MSFSVTTAFFLCLDICLAHSLTSNQFHSCWKFFQLNLRIIIHQCQYLIHLQKSTFLSRWRDDGDVIGPGIISTKANTRGTLGERMLAYLFLISQVAKDHRYYLYKDYIFIQKTDTNSTALFSIYHKYWWHHCHKER